MNDSREQFAAWVSLLSSLAALLGLVQSHTILTFAGASCAAIALAALVSWRRSRNLLRSAAINIEGLNIDSLNVANLRRTVNRSLVVQHAYHLARIDGPDLSVSWHYSGYCRSKSESTLTFSLDSENPFDELDCYAFDLRQDPDRCHPIRPLLIGGGGISKKVAVPFLKPLAAQDPFSVVLHCNLPGCLAPGVQYYTATLSFAQRRVKQCSVHLVFARHAPDWVRVYDCTETAKPRLLQHLHPFKNDGVTCEYLDAVENVPGQTMRVYVYRIGAGVG